MLNFLWRKGLDNKNRFHKIGIFLVSFCFLSACSIFEPVKVPPMHYFTLANPNLDWDCCTPQGCSTILVNPPRANAIYHSPRMIYIPACYQIQYFAQNRWADMPTQMLQFLLINSLQHTGYFQAIINTPSSTDYDWVLNTQLLSFQQEFTTFPSRFRIAMRAQLIDARSRQVIATENFVVVQTTIYDNPYGGALAANLAAQEILDKINCFCLRNS